MKQLDSKTDHYRNLAHKLGYRSRSAFKLIELNKKYKIIKRNFFVLDLGCAPGGWMQVSKKLVGIKGKIVGIDVSNMNEITGTYFIKTDIHLKINTEILINHFGRKIDSVICDIAPKVIGIRALDHVRQIDLINKCVKIMDSVLTKNGNALFKVFDGEHAQKFKHDLKPKFLRFKVTKPKSSRKSSSETYCIGLGYLYD
ncbi:MAG: 23S rRNA (uridine(2552)-2'-O)-methyltransferase [Thaumarchaeota archaeon]|nr:23S rRNA (uridine(2552)-2'-O)-methyltransferase [Nitrososphaerota archaeon]MCY3975971.1 23S rRNA (uridine(2552)-2'-O)-methyltransferase [Nitrososphaerota archaeon]